MVGDIAGIAYPRSTRQLAIKSFESPSGANKSCLPDARSVDHLAGLLNFSAKNWHSRQARLAAWVGLPPLTPGATGQYGLARANGTARNGAGLHVEVRKGN